jgi:hypothetical protein
METGGVAMKKLVTLVALFGMHAAFAQAPTPQGQTPPAPQAQGQAPQMAQMQAKMREMQALMERLHATQDPAERERLMDEHMKSMSEAMAMMDKMAGGRRMGQGGGPEMRQCPAGDATCRMDQMQSQQGMMGQRMDMMQMMMHQMMGRMAEQSGETGPSTEPSPSQGDSQNHTEHH